MFNTIRSYSIVFIILIMCVSVCVQSSFNLQILVRLWSDLPGWLLQPRYATLKYHAILNQPFPDTVNHF